MSLLHEVTLERLWSNYETRFGAPPPISNAGFDEAISLIREKLNGEPAGEQESIKAVTPGSPVVTYAALACLDDQIADAYRSEKLLNT